MLLCSSEDRAHYTLNTAIEDNTSNCRYFETLSGNFTYDSRLQTINSELNLES
jgi:hypothetical protein